MKLTVKINDVTYDVEVGDLDSRPILATIDGETFEILPEEITAPAPTIAASPAAPPPAPAARPVAAAPAAAAVVSTTGGSVIVAPLPGTVDSILVKEGVSVTQGQEVLKLEAMKMKNSIRSPRAGKVVAIHVHPGDQVRHGQALIEIGD
ncbi:MAG: biotin/lipoyl-containing protein [Bellilinea sp.]